MAITRTYVGRPAGAADLMRNDARELAPNGYVPVSQSYAPGQYRGTDFVAALLLCVVLVGFLVFIYMLVVKPEGTLTVIYERRNAPSGSGVAATAAPAEQASVEQRLARLDALRNTAALTDEEYSAKRASILSDL